MVFDAKLNFSAFWSTALDRLLQEHGISTVFLTGMNTDFCVFATALDSFYRGYETRVIQDAVSTVSGARAHAEALGRIRAHFGDDAVVSTVAGL
ncbi:Isochorismatase-like protein [Pavlovales sp. CCMP2436]|nr:Isochorismatase-like protein [Pavlovales sp. CCMP2436]